MRDFLYIAMELCAISVIQSLVEAIFEERRGYIKIMSVLCSVVSFYIVLSYVYTHILSEIMFIFRGFI